jgi:hypothetical protein
MSAQGEFDFNGENGDGKPPEDSYLRPREKDRRRRCRIFEKNPHWDGVLRSRASARNSDREESHEAAEGVNGTRDMAEARVYIDRILARGDGIISTELREEVLQGIARGEIDSLGLAPNVRAESIRRRFSDFC